MIFLLELLLQALNIFHPGGLAAVIYLDTLMAVVMVGGSVVMTIMGMQSKF